MPETRKLKTVVLDAGKLRKRELKALKEGTGPLSEEVRAAAARAATTGSEVVPIVILYERRPKKPRGFLGGLLRKL
jgi:hypothetical protein